jgi:N-ethylmaleimide reductase
MPLNPKYAYGKTPMTTNNRQKAGVDIFSGVSLGCLTLANRIVMAPMTRSRAGSDAVPTQLMVDYYAQRASAGLIISEGIAPSANGLGYCRTPGLFNDAQIAAWSRVTAAVHAAGGKIVAQLMHVGRVANQLNKPAGSETVAPSAIRARGEIYTDQSGMMPFDSPRELHVDEIPAVVEEYRRATGNAFAAGFDGVELHCASGYLPAQFLSTGTNQRTDAYGGSVVNRCRFPLEILAAIVSVGGSGRVGMRICPDNPFNDLSDENPLDTFEHLLEASVPLDLAYVHVIRLPTGRVDNIELAQRFFGDRLIVNDSYSIEEASKVVATRQAVAVSFGRPYIANPDLVERFQAGAALAKFDPRTLYAGDGSGYTDYPPLANQCSAT